MGIWVLTVDARGLARWMVLLWGADGLAFGLNDSVAIASLSVLS